MKCHACNGTHFGSRELEDGTLMRHCHDEHGIGCKNQWHESRDSDAPAPAPATTPGRTDVSPVQDREASGHRMDGSRVRAPGPVPFAPAPDMLTKPQKSNTSDTTCTVAEHVGALDLDEMKQAVHVWLQGTSMASVFARYVDALTATLAERDHEIAKLEQVAEERRNRAKTAESKLAAAEARIAEWIEV